MSPHAAVGLGCEMNLGDVETASRDRFDESSVSRGHAFSDGHRAKAPLQRWYIRVPCTEVIGSGRR